MPYGLNPYQTVPVPSTISASVTQTGYQASGTLLGISGLSTLVTTGVAVQQIEVSNASVSSYATLTALPQSGNWKTPLPSGTYTYGVRASSFANNGSTSLPDQVNRSFYQLGTVTF